MRGESSREEKSEIEDRDLHVRAHIERQERESAVGELLLVVRFRENLLTEVTCMKTLMAWGRNRNGSSLSSALWPCMSNLQKSV